MLFLRYNVGEKFTPRRFRYMKREKNRTQYKRPTEGYTEENFRRWSNAQRCAFIENQIDVLTRNNSEMAKRLDISEETLDQMRKDAATLRKLAQAEENARKTLAASVHMTMEKEEQFLLEMLRKKGIDLSPKDILGKKGN